MWLAEQEVSSVLGCVSSVSLAYVSGPLSCFILFWGVMAPMVPVVGWGDVGGALFLIIS